MSKTIIKISTAIVALFFNMIYCSAQGALSRMAFAEGKTTVIKKEVDLKGKDLFLPKNVVLKFKKGGCIKNGRVIADNANITGYKSDIFDDVQISGYWTVKYISTAMFKNITELNALKNVLALTSDKVENVVTIEDGQYMVAAERSGQPILNVPSNTEVIINGKITMLPNDFTNYYILKLNGENIRLHGKGEIVGDKFTHTGLEGEWGMGVMISGCRNVSVCDLTIKDCWGDCIYINLKSTDIRISNCTLDHGRRQGISIVSAGKVLIENCFISNVGGTAPEYAIDVEPNKGDVVESVIIRNVKSLDCKGGFLTWGGAKESLIDNVELYDCYVKGASKPSYAFNTSNVIKMVNCTSDKDTQPHVNKCKTVIIRD